MNDNGVKYTDCIANFEEMTTLLEHCLPVGSELTIAIEKLDKIICGNSCLLFNNLSWLFETNCLINMLIADQAKLKCKSPDALKSLNLVKDCMTENNSEFKSLVEKKLNKNQCKTEAKNIFMKAIKDNKFNVIDCIEMNKDQIDQANPFEKCTGLN